MCPCEDPPDHEIAYRRPDRQRIPEGKSCRKPAVRFFYQMSNKWRSLLRGWILKPNATGKLKKASFGVRKPRHFLGRLFRRFTIRGTSSFRTSRKSILLSKQRTNESIRVDKECDRRGISRFSTPRLLGVWTQLTLFPDLLLISFVPCSQGLWGLTLRR